LDYEHSKNPFRERKEQIAKWRAHAVEDIIENGDVLSIAGMLQKQGIKKIDSLHVACAIFGGSD